MICPKCQKSEVWDNGPSKAAGKIKPNAPDLACKDKEGCGWKQWPPKGPVTGYAKEQTPKQPLSERPAPLRETEPMPWDTNPKDEQLVALYWDCYDRVLAGLKTRAIRDGFHDEQIAACVATMFIARSRAL